MKKLLFLITLCVFISCKHEYHCDASMDGITEDKHCMDCSKSEAEAYEKKLEEEGYTDVHCDKE